MYDSQNNIHEF